jgi:hypothetical protein
MDWEEADNVSAQRSYMFTCVLFFCELATIKTKSVVQNRHHPLIKMVLAMIWNWNISDQLALNTNFVKGFMSAGFCSVFYW